MPKNTPHGVLLVEDDAHTRARLAEVIEASPALALQAAAASCAEARAALARAVPEVLLTDLGLPDGSGLALIRETHSLAPPPLAMVITVLGDEATVLSAIEAGASGYLLKDGTPDDVTEAIGQLLAGGSPISPSIARHLIRRFQPPASAASADGASHAPHLSAREAEVLALISKGFSVGEIAKLLGISAHTVATHVRGIYRKLEVSSRGEAVFEALQLGLIKSGA